MRSASFTRAPVPSRRRCVFPSYNGRVETVDVIVAGAGIIGLSTALELAKSGLRVRVVEKGHAMGEASWAAAGMLAPLDPDLDKRLVDFAALSARLYPEYLASVERLSGRKVPLRTHATLHAVDGASESASPYAISAAEAAKRVPGLVTKGRSFLWLEESSLDPRDLCVALPVAAAAAGVELIEETEVMGVTCQARSVAVKTQKGTMSAGSFVNCCGAWAGRAQPIASAVEPWKGQMHTVQLPDGLDLPYVLRTPEVYLVPRGNGSVVVGATVERAGFDRQVEPSALAWLGVLAADLWPPIGKAPVLASWTGLRPGTRDGLPLIGSAGEPNCWVATGHFRNGILLAPATGLLVRQLLQGETPAVELAAFVPGR
jgi:glycine oxidase